MRTTFGSREATPGRCRRECLSLRRRTPRTVLPGKRVPAKQFRATTTRAGVQAQITGDEGAKDMHPARFSRRSVQIAEITAEPGGAVVLPYYDGDQRAARVGRRLERPELKESSSFAVTAKSPSSCAPTPIRPPNRRPARRLRPVLEIAVILLVVAWLLGVISGITFEGQIHLLLLLAVAVAVLRLTVVRRLR